MASTSPRHSTRPAMARSVLVDAGFVVALLNRDDGHHQWARTQASELPPPWQSCEAALSEAFHLLGTRGVPALAALLRRDAMRISFRLATDLEPVLSLMKKYADVPMDFPDATLVLIAEQSATDRILSLDRRGFASFRFGKNRRFKNLPTKSAPSSYQWSSGFLLSLLSQIIFMPLTLPRP